MNAEDTNKYPKCDPRWTSEERAQELLASINGTRWGGGRFTIHRIDGAFRTAKLVSRNGIEVSCKINGPTSDPDVMQEVRCTLINKFFEETQRLEDVDKHTSLVEAQKNEERRANRANHWADWFKWLK